MAELGKFDVTLLFTMALAVVSMSFVMPALGLSSTSTSANDIPELNVSESRFDLVGSFPEAPNTATSGTMYYNTTKQAAFSNNAFFLDGDTSAGYELLLLQEPSTNDTEVQLQQWSSGSVVAEQNATLDAANPTAVLSVGDYVVGMQLAADHNPPDYLQAEWNVKSQPQPGGSFIGRIPVVGSIFQTAEVVASVVAWLTTVFIWFSTSIVEAFLNVIGIVFDVSVYFIRLLTWLTTTYTSVVSAADSWVTVFVALPGIILSVTLGKVVVIFIRLLPTT